MERTHDEGERPLEPKDWEERRGEGQQEPQPNRPTKRRSRPDDAARRRRRPPHPSAPAR